MKKKVEITITDENGSTDVYDVSSLLQPITPMSMADSYRYHSMCARATLFPNKSIEEVKVIIEDQISKWHS